MLRKTMVPSPAGSSRPLQTLQFFETMETTVKQKHHIPKNWVLSNRASECQISLSLSLTHSLTHSHTHTVTYCLEYIGMKMSFSTADFIFAMTALTSCSNGLLDGSTVGYSWMSRLSSPTKRSVCDVDKGSHTASTSSVGNKPLVTHNTQLSILNPQHILSHIKGCCFLSL